MNSVQYKGNFHYLLFALLGFILFIAILAEFPGVGAGNLFLFGLEITLIIGIWGFIDDRKVFLVGMTLIGIGLLATVIRAISDYEWLGYISLITALAFYIMTAWLAFKVLFLGSIIDLNRIAGSVCVYLLVGICFGFLFYFTLILIPGSFIGLEDTDDMRDLIDLLYYSYVTISTLGYGDITPVSPVARTLAFLEALFGQFYIAIIVASLVGAHLSKRSDKS